MIYHSKDDAVTISCSDSSDDEEEQRRISEAVSGVSTSGYQKSDSGSKGWGVFSLTESLCYFFRADFNLLMLS